MIASNAFVDLLQALQKTSLGFSATELRTPVLP